MAQGLQLPHTSFPGGGKPQTGSANERRKSEAKPKRRGRRPKPCKYGPRGADGYCPPKPAGERSGEATVPRTLPKYPQRPKAQSRLAKLTTEEKALLGALGLAGRRAARATVRRLATIMQRLGNKRVRVLLRAAATGGRAGKTVRGARVAALAIKGLGAAGAAGIAAYYATRAIIRRRAKTEEDKRYNAGQAWGAYNRMIRELERKQGKPLTESQHADAWLVFEAELVRHGTTWDEVLTWSQ